MTWQLKALTGLCFLLLLAWSITVVFADHKVFESQRDDDED